MVSDIALAVANYLPKISPDSVDEIINASKEEGYILHGGLDQAIETQGIALKSFSLVPNSENAYKPSSFWGKGNMIFANGTKAPGMFYGTPFFHYARRGMEGQISIAKISNLSDCGIEFRGESELTTGSHVPRDLIHIVKTPQDLDVSDTKNPYYSLFKGIYEVTVGGKFKQGALTQLSI